MFSRPIPGTNIKKSKLSWWDYWIGHCIATGFQSIRNSFITWMDLMWFPDNQQSYSLLSEDDPLEQCELEFWYSINEDDTYPKEFIEELQQMVIDIDDGNVELIPWDDVKDQLLLRLDDEE